MKVAIKADLGSTNGRAFFRILRPLRPFSDEQYDDNASVRIPACIEPLVRHLLSRHIDLDDAGYYTEEE